MNEEVIVCSPMDDCVVFFCDGCDCDRVCVCSSTSHTGSPNRGSASNSCITVYCILYCKITASLMVQCCMLILLVHLFSYHKNFPTFLRSLRSPASVHRYEYGTST